MFHKVLVFIFSMILLSITFVFGQTINPATPILSPSPEVSPSITPYSGQNSVSTLMPPNGTYMTKYPSLAPINSLSRKVFPTLTPTISNINQSKEKGFFIIFNEEKLFPIYASISTYSPEERAKIIIERLKKVSQDSLFVPDEIKVDNGEENPMIIYKDIIIMTVREKDVQSPDMTQKELAEKYAEKIRQVIGDYTKARSYKSIFLGIIYSLIATMAFIIIITVLNKLLKMINDKIRLWHKTDMLEIKIQKLVIISKDSLLKNITNLINLLSFILKLIICYTYLSIVFSFFVWTKGIGAKLISNFLSAGQVMWVGFLAYLPRLILLVSAVLITYYVIKFIGFIFAEPEKGTLTVPGFYKEWAQPTYSISKFLIIALTLVITLPYFPIYETPAFKGMSIFLGVLFSLGSTAVVSNMMAGIVLIYMNAFRLGDRVRIGDTEGNIIEKTLFLTRIRTIKNVDITIPNAIILGSHIINYSSSEKEKGLILHTSVTIGYDAPWRTIHQLLIEAALATEDILKEPAPFVFQTSLDDFYVTYQINAYTDKSNYMGRIYSDLHKNIQDKLNEAKVEIMSPHYTSLRDGNHIAIPEDYLPDGYKSPKFNISSENNTVRIEKKGSD